MKKRILSLFLTVLMVLSLFSAFSVSVNAAGAINFVYRPTVLIGGGGYYNVIWQNNVEGIGYVQYTYKDTTYTVYDEEDGVVCSGDYRHSIRIPTEHLDGATRIEAFACSIKSRNGFDIKIDQTVSQIIKFKGYTGQSEINIGLFSDLHIGYEPYKPLQNAVSTIKNHMGNLDMIGLLGDIGNVMDHERYLNSVFAACQETFEASGGAPVLYVKGNHECRGGWSKELSKFFAFETEECYGYFEYGPIGAFVFDSGEDKEDAHQEYGDLNAMEHYKEEELEWFRSVETYSADSQYRLIFSHSANIIDFYFTDEIISAAKTHNPDCILNGHSHALQLVRGTTRNPIPQFHDGGHDNNTTLRCSKVSLKNGIMTFTGYSPTGEIILNEKLETQSAKKGASAIEPAKSTTTIKSAAAEEATEEATEEVTEEAPKAESIIPTAAGVAATALKAAADTTAITVKPTVFDGGKVFNVVWQSTPGLSSTGEVEVTTSSGKARFKDATVGKIRTGSTHSVKIPKYSFGNGTYEAKTRVVIHYTYGGYVSSPPTSYGAYVSAGKVSFMGEPTANQQKYTVLAVTDVDSYALAEKVKSALGNKKPNILVTLGNMVNKLDTEEDFRLYLRSTYAITEGKYPVIYVRGEGECTGAFAAEIGRYIRNTTEEMVNGKFYLNTTFGPLSIIALDTGLESADIASAYNGYANFNPIRQEQVDWLGNTIPKSFAGTYNILFSHADNIRDVHGYDFTENLGKIGINLSVGGTSGKSALSIAADSYSKAIVGSPNVDKTYGMLLTCEDDKIIVNALGGNELGEVDVETSVANNSGSNGGSNDSGSNGGSNNNGSNNNGSNDSGSNGGTGNTDSNNNGNTGSGNTTQEPEYLTGPQIIPGEFGGLEGEMYIRNVAEGWYRDYLTVGFELTDAVPASTSKTNEKQFVHMTAKLSGVNLELFTTASTDADKAAAWASQFNIYPATPGKAAASDSMITSIMSVMFE